MRKKKKKKTKSAKFNSCLYLMFNFPVWEIMPTTFQAPFYF